MDVLLCTSEAFPFVGSGGLGDVAGSLPVALTRLKVDCRVVLPLYSAIKEEYRKEMKYICNFNVNVSWRNQYCGVFELVLNGITYYFLDNMYYFYRDNNIYGYYDDAERFAFFSRAIPEMLRRIEYFPQVVHVNDWQTALVPLYLKVFYANSDKMSQIKTVFTIHNIQYQGRFDIFILNDILGLGSNEQSLAEFDYGVNYMKAGIECADYVNTVSPTYANEILDSRFSYGLDGILRGRRDKLCGILNGIDTDEYNPETDRYIKENYTVKTVKTGKALCKKELCERFALSDNGEPIVAMVTRLVSHKGIDLVQHTAGTLLENGIRLVLLGSGDIGYETHFNYLAQHFPGRVGVYIGFDSKLARKIYAGADMLLMPSSSEPCGLSQMIAARYATVPIVRETGGLNDSIKDDGDDNGNGFTFKDYNAGEMFDCCMRAKKRYCEKEKWTGLITRCMTTDFSWKASAQKYLELYKTICNIN